MKIYSKFEFDSMLRFQKMKDAFFVPITNILVQMRVSANTVSIFSGLIALGSLMLALTRNQPIIFIIGIWLHFFLDGLDGALSRAANNKPSTLGVIIDLVSDSVGIFAVGAYLFSFGFSGGIAVLVFLSTYFSINFFSFYFARTGRQFEFIVRPRLYVFLAITLDALFALSVTAPVIFLSNILLSFFTLVGLRKLATK